MDAYLLSGKEQGHHGLSDLSSAWLANRLRHSGIRLQPVRRSFQTHPNAVDQAYRQRRASSQGRHPFRRWPSAATVAAAYSGSLDSRLILLTVFKHTPYLRTSSLSILLGSPSE